MALRLRIPSTDKIGEGFMLGIGIFGAYVLLRGALKLADQYSGGVIPDEFMVAQAEYNAYPAYDDYYSEFA
jgi:hypothetical protein